MGTYKAVKCDKCKGSGRYGKRKCRKCGGRGFIWKIQKEENLNGKSNKS